VLYRDADAACVSGYKWDLVEAGGTLEWVVPAGSVPPGDYHVVIRIGRTNGSHPIPLEVSTSVSMNSVFYATEERNLRVQGPDETWVIRSLGTFTLPGARVGSSGSVHVSVQRTDLAEPVGSIFVDELWLFKADGALTIVEGLLHPILKIVAPSLDEPSGAIWGTDDDTMAESVLCSSLTLSRQHHDLHPGTNMVFTVTTENLDPTVSATAYKRWSSYPAE
jgi:hypothetical protein